MKSNRFYKVITAIAFMLLLNQFSAIGQTYYYWQLGGNPDNFPTNLGLLSTSNFFGGNAGGIASLQFGTGGNTYMFLGGSSAGASNGLLGIGNGFSAPIFQVDILGNYIGDGVNVSNYTNTPNNAVGYSIGGRMFLWHGGGQSSVYCGYYAGTNTTPPTPCTGNYYNTFVGYQADASFNASAGQDNTAIGATALYSNTSGNENTAVGSGSLSSNISGFDNVAVGVSALGGNNGNFNTACGEMSLEENTIGVNNTGVGYASGWLNRTGINNSSLGYTSLQWNLTGSENTAMGSYALDDDLSDSNTAIGYYSLYNIDNGSGNTALGNSAGLSASNTAGYDNTFLGTLTDAYASGINGATAIGAKAQVTASNQIEVGNNNASITMGLSTFAPTGPTRLELNTEHGVPTFTYTSGAASPTWVNPTSSVSPTGWSGLAFDDLTSTDVPGDNPGAGVLSVDGAGNVILVNANSAANTGFGACSSAPALLANAGINLNTKNLYFVGNTSGTADENDVYLGYACGYTPISGLDQKLSVLESSQTDNSIGIYVENDDGNSGTLTPIATFTSTIGIESYLPGTGPCSYFNVAGWFEADNKASSCNANQQYAIFVPSQGGTVDIGYKFAADKPDFLLDVDGTTQCMYNLWTSDSTLKTNVVPITQNNDALSVVQKLNGVSFNFIPSAITDSGVTGTHYGFIAQQVKRVLPNLVKTNGQGIEAVAYTEVIPWLTEAIKQEKQTNDSLRYTLDSLRSAFKSILACLTIVCPPPGDAPVHGNGGNGNNGDNTIGNAQDVTLSANANAPLLYQNVPNPFSTGTKINYYLPVGTQGATMLFYDSYGNQLKTVELSQTGNGTLNITPDNLSAGIYSYSLVVNGNVIDTKRMLLQK